MSNISIQGITKATVSQFTTSDAARAPFDTVCVVDGDGFRASLFLPAGTGQAVADAINAAVKS